MVDVELFNDFYLRADVGNECSAQSVNHNSIFYSVQLNQVKMEIKSSCYDVLWHIVGEYSAELYLFALAFSFETSAVGNESCIRWNLKN